MNTPNPENTTRDRVGQDESTGTSRGPETAPLLKQLQTIDEVFKSVKKGDTECLSKLDSIDPELINAYVYSRDFLRRFRDPPLALTDYIDRRALRKAIPEESVDIVNNGMSRFADRRIENDEVAAMLDYYIIFIREHTIEKDDSTKAAALRKKFHNKMSLEQIEFCVNRLKDEGLYGIPDQIFFMQIVQVVG